MISLMDIPDVVLKSKLTKMSRLIEDAAASKSIFGNHSSGNLNAHTGSGPQNNNNADGSQYNATAIYIIEKYYSERPETPPQPSATIPFSRDPDFVDRGDILERINRILSEPAARVALVGLGGIGKSQLAIEFAHRIAIGQPNTWVFWVHAGTQARVEEGFMAIADAIKLPGRNQPKADIPQLVYGWLSNERNGKWIMILDSADDRDVFYGETRQAPNSRPLATYLPQSRNGAILVTTRNKDLARRLTGNDANILDVGPMVEADALSLVEKKLGLLDTGRATELVRMLGYVPLAVSQAAGYIQARAPRSSLEKYLDEFQAGERKRIELLGHDGGDLRRDGSVSNAILTTWQMSFEHICSKRPSAAYLLSLMSFFDRQGIPESLLKDSDGARGIGSDGKLEPGELESEDDRNEAEDMFEDDVAMLRDYCLVSTNEAGDMFEMHDLVQLSTRKWLEARGLQEKFKVQFVKRMAISFPTGDYSNWVICRRLFVHVEKAMSCRPADGDMEEVWARLLYNGGWYAWLQGRYEIAERMVGKARRTREKRLGREDEASLQSISLYALVVNARGRWKEAESLEVQVIKTRKRVLGEEHPDTLTSMSNLASTYRDQGRWTEAESLEVQVMEIRKRVLGEGHPNTLISMANLASTYTNQGRWKEAESLEVQVMEMFKKMLGEEHPFTLTSIANLASTYMNQGRWKEAEPLEVQVIETRKRVLGEEHPDTLGGISNLASTYRNRGRWTEAESLFMQVIEMRKRVLGEEHPDTLISIANLASTYRNQGRWIEAKSLEVQVMETFKKMLGEEHPNTLTSMANLASTYTNQGRWKEAESLFVQVIEIRKRVLGEEHPDTLTSIANLAVIYTNQGRWKEAELLEVRVMETSLKVLGEEHPDTLSSIANLASTYSNQGRWKEAEDLQAKDLNICSRVLGEEHPNTLTSMNNLALMYRKQGRWKEAKLLFLQVVEIRKTVLGEEHPDTLISIANLVSTYRNQGQWKEAESLEVQVMETRKIVLGEEHPDTLTSMANLAFTWEDQGRHSDALALMRDCAEAQRRVLGEEHPNTLSSLAAVAAWSS